MEGELVRLARSFVVAISAMPAFAQYAGPAILSRGEAPASMSTLQIDFRPFLNISGTYTTGLSGVSAGPQGTLGNTASEGLLVSFGVSGTHSWKHTKVGLNYVGSISHYTKTTYYGGYNQSLLLSVTHQLSRHASFSLRENAAISSQAAGLPGLPQTVPFDPASTYNPTTDFYDNRTTSLSTQASFTLQKSARLSFNLSAQDSLTYRQSSALYSVGGMGANGDVQYRLTRRSTVGVNYGYTHFGYHGLFGATDVHSVSGTYALQLSRSLEFTGFGGFARTESKFLQNVPIDPVIAALIGLPNGVVISHSIVFHPNYGGRLSRSFQRGVVFLSSAYSVTPGNGLFLTSTALSASTGYTYTGIRRWSLGATAAYTRANSVSNVVGAYGDVSGSLSTSRQIGRFTHMALSFSAMQYRSSSFVGYNRLTYSANLGLAFSPGNIPLRIW
jgi:hypothetical protein